MTDHVIIAPHPDDEIIGTYSILVKHRPIILYTELIDEARKEETLNLKNNFDIKAQLYLRQIPGMLMKNENIFYFPDPIYETHPAHRLMGAVGETFARSGYNVIFYTTNMLAPYIHEVKNPEDKETALTECYPSQKDLWRYDARYYLFEGRCKWMFNEPVNTQNKFLAKK